MGFQKLFHPSASMKWILRTGDLDSLEHYHELSPQEVTAVDEAVPDRKSQFADARWCAHQALRAIGVTDGEPIIRGPHGMPIFPKGVAGSITHSAGLRAAVVAPKKFVHSIGIDVEPATPLHDNLLSSVANDAEEDMVYRLQRAGLIHADRLLFSAKEATYKAWFPITQRFMEFDEVQIDLRFNGTFNAYPLLRPTPVPLIEGKWTVAHGFLMTSALVHANGLCTLE